MPSFKVKNRSSFKLQKGKDAEGRGYRKNQKIFLWKCDDVIKWLKKCCGAHYQYAQTFREHDITGRSLLRLNDWKLQKMEIHNPEHREDLLRSILRLRLKSEYTYLKELEDKDENENLDRK